MFGSIGGPELIVIFVLALLIFGPRKLPQLGRTIGRGLAEFRKAATDLRQALDTEVAVEEDKARAARAIEPSNQPDKNRTPEAIDAGKPTESD